MVIGRLLGASQCLIGASTSD